MIWAAGRVKNEDNLAAREPRATEADPAARELRTPEPPAALNGHGHQAAELFAADIASGSVPGIRRIRTAPKVGQPSTAGTGYLTALAAGNGQGGGGAPAR
jgi:hypothetical protein